MDLSLALMGNIGAMLIWCAVGFAIVRIGLLKSADSKAVSTLCVYVMTPCVLVCAFQIDLTEDRLTGFLTAFLFSMAVQAVWIVLTRLLRKPFHLQGIDQATLIYTNCGNLIFPLVSMTLGGDMVFYASAYIVAFSILLWTHGVSAVRGARTIQLKKMLLNPNIIAIAIGFGLMVTGVKIPSVLYTAMNGLSSMIGPASMISIGMVIGGISLKRVFMTPKAYFLSAGRLIALPVLTLGILWLTGICRRFPAAVPVLMIAFLSAAAPSSATVSQLAVVYDNHAEEAGIYNVLTTLFCVITMPLMILLYQVWIG